MSFSFQDVTDYSEDLINDNVEFIGDGVKSVSDSVSGSFGDGGNPLDTIAGPAQPTGAQVFQYPESLCAGYQETSYQSDPEKDDSYLAESAVTSESKDPFIFFTFKEISTTMDDVAKHNFQSYELLERGALAVTAMAGASLFDSLTDKKTAKKVVGAGSAVAIIQQVSSSLEAMSKTFDEKPKRHATGRVALYMPPSIQIADTANYDAMSRQALSLAREVNKSIRGLGEGDLKFGHEGEAGILASAIAGETIMGGGLVGGAAGAVGISSMAGSAAFGEVIKLTGDEELRTLGKALNPNEYMQFKSINLRQFNLSFKFLPDSVKESNDVEQIIKMFRKAMYPIEHSNLTMTVPDILEIQFHNVAGMVKMPELALTNVNLTYNPNAASFFKHSGHPVEISMDITLQELYPIHRAEVEKGGY